MLWINFYLLESYADFRVQRRSLMQKDIIEIFLRGRKMCYNDRVIA